MRTPTPAVAAAANGALAAEQQAVWGYPVLGPRLTDVDQITMARAASDAHRTGLTTLSSTLSGLGISPVAAQAAYPLPSPVTDAAGAAAYAVSLEQACAAAWRFLVVRTSGGDDIAGLKGAAVDALTASAVRAATWRRTATPLAATVAFPGT